MAQVSGSLVTRNYKNFRGLDLREGEVNITRSPNALNMWKNYKEANGISTRPELELVETYDNTIWGLFFYKVGNVEMQIVHSGTKLYRVIAGEREELFTGMKPARSQAFVYNNMFYIKDGINYLKYDGQTCSQIVGFIPTTSIARKPSGGGTTYQDVNMLSAWRKNTFLGDGESTVYHLDAQNIDGDAPIVYVDGTELTVLTDFNYDPTAGTITFVNAPNEPLTDGQDNVEITFKKTVTGYADRINKCTLLQVFDNRVFFSGNVEYPNVVWHSSLNDPSYCSDLDYYNEGLDLAPVKSMVAGNNALWVFKEPSQANTTVFYHNPVVDAEYGKIYPSSHSSISTGCVATGINFNDDICFFSERGMEAISSDVTTEQVVAHRSSLIDSKLLSEANYKDMILEEWEGYLLVIIDNKVYLADSRAMFENGNHNEYEWFYWELEKNITCTRVKDGVLYLCTSDGVYKVGHEESDYTEVTFTEENGEYVLYGESTQETRSGKNEFTGSYANYAIGGSTGDQFFPSDACRTAIVEIKPNTTYTVTKYGENIGNRFVIADYPSYVTETTEINVLINVTPATTLTITTNSDANYLYVYVDNEGTEPLLQIEEGSVATEYEEYGAMPSPDYPSEIVNTYKAGIKYRTTINGREYRFMLSDDLRSAGSVKDRVYLSDGKLYIEKNIDTGILNGNEEWFLSSLGTYQVFGLEYEGIKQGSEFTSNYFINIPKVIHLVEKIGISNNNAVNRIYISNGSTTLEEFKTWLSENNVTVHYELATSTTNEICFTTSPTSYWCTPLDKFNYANYQKTTNKRGCIAETVGEDIKLYVKTNKTEWELIGTYTNITDYFVSRIKRKKFKDIQLKFYSDKRFNLESATLECYIGGYIKR